MGQRSRKIQRKWAEQYIAEEGKVYLRAKCDASNDIWSPKL